MGKKIKEISAPLIIGSPLLVPYIVTTVLIMKAVSYVKINPILVVANVVVNSMLASYFIGAALYFIINKKVFNYFYMTFLFLSTVFFFGIDLFFKYFRFIPSPMHLKQISDVPYVIHQITELLFDRYDAFMACGVFVIGAIVFSFKKGFFNTINSSLKSKCMLLAAVIFLILIKFYILSFRFGVPVVNTYNRERDKIAVSHGYAFIIGMDLFSFNRFSKKNVKWPGTIENLVALGRQSQVGEDNRKFANHNGFNIITIQVESLDYEIINYKINGEPVMPFLRGLADNSLYFNNFFAQHRGGGSADAELSTFTSLQPLKRISGFIYGNFDKVTPLPRLLTKNGYYAAAMHANDGSFYSRDRVYKKMGFERFDDAKSFTGDASGWMSKDIEFFKQVMEKIKEFKNPFYLHLITMQSHGPFKNHSRNEGLFDFSDLEDAVFQDYILVMREVDDAFKRFFSELSETGILKKTLFVIYADHSSLHKYPFNYNGKINGEICSNDNCQYYGERIPLLIYSPLLRADAINKVGSHIDLAPTITGLVGLASDKKWLGSSLLNGKPGVAILEKNPVSIVYNKGDEIEIDLTNDDYYRVVYDYTAAELF